MHDRDHTNKEACNREQQRLTQADLPLCCPPLDKRSWDAHPRVYLPIEETGQIVCPYCGTAYVLTDFSASSASLIAPADYLPK